MRLLLRSTVAVYTHLILPFGYVYTGCYVYTYTFWFTFGLHTVPRFTLRLLRCHTFTRCCRGYHYTVYTRLHFAVTGYGYGWITVHAVVARWLRFTFTLRGYVTLHVRYTVGYVTLRYVATRLPRVTVGLHHVTHVFVRLVTVGSLVDYYVGLRHVYILVTLITLRSLVTFTFCLRSVYGLHFTDLVTHTFACRTRCVYTITPRLLLIRLPFTTHVHVRFVYHHGYVYTFVYIYVPDFVGWLRLHVTVTARYHVYHTTV